MRCSSSSHGRYETVRKHEFHQVFQAVPALKPLYMQWEKDYDAETLYWFIVDNSWLPWFSIILYLLFIFGYPEVWRCRELILLRNPNAYPECPQELENLSLGDWNTHEDFCWLSITDRLCWLPFTGSEILVLCLFSQQLVKKYNIPRYQVRTAWAIWNFLLAAFSWIGAFRVVPHFFFLLNSVGFEEVGSGVIPYTY